MDITIDIDREVKDTEEARQATLIELQKLDTEKQGVIAQALEPHKQKLQGIEAKRQNLLQELLRVDGELRGLIKQKSKAEAKNKPKTERKKSKKHKKN